jgi:hypothetical protein
MADQFAQNGLTKTENCLRIHERTGNPDFRISIRELIHEAASKRELFSIVP